MFKFSPAVFLFGFVSLVLCQDEGKNRLPTTTYPIEYKLWLDLPSNLDEFNGHVEIKIGVLSETDEIIVNQYNLNIISAELAEVNDGKASTDELIIPEEQLIEHNLLLKRKNEAMLEVAKEYVLKIVFTGHYNKPGIGIYKSTFTNDIGDTVPIIATNFAPQYARYAFPCYDEPHFKTPYTISIQHPDGYRAISNMGHQETDTLVDTELTTTIFHETPSLSTHSIAFAVTSYESFCNQDELKICVYYDQLHTEDDVKLTLETAEKTIKELENYLGVALNLPKLDIVPGMNEPIKTLGNFGLLINKESLYYYNSKTSSVEQKDLVIGHTIHQIITIYFMHVITPEWWADIWINDGISIILGYLVADKLYPEIDATGQFIDSLYRSGFIQVTIKPADDLSHKEITDLFNGTIHYKSAGIMYMFKNIVSEERFIDGLKKLLTDETKSYSSDMFFNIFQQFAVEDGFIPVNYDLNTIMNVWIEELSHPILQADINYETGIVTLIQQNVLSIYDGTKRIPPWFVPYNFKTQDEDTNKWLSTTPNGWLEKNNNFKHELKGTLDKDKWIVYNKELSGFYHTNYDIDNWNLLAAQLDTNHTIIPMISRTQLLHDSILFALNGEVELDVIFKIANYINKEVEYAPISRFLSQFVELDTKIFGTDVYENFTKFTLHKIKHLYDRIRITDLNANLNVTLMDAKLFKNLIVVACYMGHKHCLEDTNKLLVDAIKSGADGVNTLMRSEFGYNILTYGLVSADEELFWKIVELYNDGDDTNTNQEYYSAAVGYVQDPELVDQLLNILSTKNGNKVNGIEIKLDSNDRIRALKTLVHLNPSGLDKSIAMMAAKPDIVKELFDEYVGTVFLEISYRITTDERLENFKELVGIYDTDLPDVISYQDYIDIAQTQVNWANKKIPEFQTVLADILDTIENEGTDDDEDDGAAVLTISTVLMLSLLFIVYLCK